MNSIIAIYVFIFGLCIGSFLNVVILRGLSGENFIISRSKCPKCGNQLKWYMNIPLISYIFLRGKCAFCKEKISIQYPIVEFVCACAFLITFLTFGLSLKTLFICVFLSLFIALSVTDILETVIIDYHAYILFAISLLYAVLNIGDTSIIQAVIGGIGGFIVVEAIARIGYLIYNYRMFGEGDSLIALGLGGIFGIRDFLAIFALSVLVQSFLAIPVLIYKAYKDRKYRLIFSYALILIALFSVFYINIFSNIKNSYTYIGVVIIITTALLWSLKNILNSIKNKKELSFEEAKEKFNLFPFGPAMVIAGTIGIFYIEQIKIAIKMFLY